VEKWACLLGGRRALLQQTFSSSMGAAAAEAEAIVLFCLDERRGVASRGGADRMFCRDLSAKRTNQNQTKLAALRRCRRPSSRSCDAHERLEHGGP
jgi:hypothetical protein